MSTMTLEKPLQMTLLPRRRYFWQRCAEVSAHAMNPPRVVIIGGGFGGVQCARTLRRHLPPRECEIVLFDTENHLVFYPLLAEVAGASIHPESTTVPLRQMLRSVYCRG